jgi:3,4-dihydroxy 2-butanone 4-phosphate synthase / GTP cyclohydrolase II
LECGVDARSTAPLTTRHGVVFVREYRSPSGAFALALSVGDLGSVAPLTARVHSSCFTSEGLGGLDCDCVAQLDAALEAIARLGRGVVFYLLQEGRGAGLANKARDRAIVQESHGAIDTYGAYARLGLPPDPRSYDIVRPICADLGIRAPLALMTNNPAKVAALRVLGLEVEPVQHVRAASRFNAEYLAAKARFGHRLPLPKVPRAAPPARLDGERGQPDRHRSFRLAASYFLPVDVAGAPAWFRASVWVDEVSRHDRMILRYFPGAIGRGELRHVYRDDFRARIRGSGAEMARYKSALRQIVERGAGAVLAAPCDQALLMNALGPSEADELELLRAESLARGAERHEEVG